MRERLRKYLYEMIALLIVIAIGVGWACFSESLKRAAKCEDMDKRELHYDADDDFILIDTQEGLMGVYHGCDPLKHFWVKDLRRVKPGLYQYDSYEDIFELGMADTDEVYRVKLREKDLRYLQETIKRGIPVLAY